MPLDAGYATAVWLFVRGVGVTAVIAFGSLLVQLHGLFCSDGLAPIAERAARGRPSRGWRRSPSLFHLDAGDRTLWAVAVGGLLAAALVAVDVLVVPALVVVFVCYGSFVNLGTPFLSYQWDVLLLETVAVAAVAALATPPAPLALLAVWVLSARLVFTSGVVKLRSGDETWRDGTAMTHHFETQPLPTRWGWWAHQLPAPLLRATTRAVLAVELAVPVLLFTPWPWRAGAVAGLVLLQIAILVTGNYGFFNLLSLVLLVPLIPDAVWAGWGVAGSGAVGAAPAALVWTATAVAAGLLLLNGCWLLMLTGPPAWARRVVAAALPWRLSSQYGLFANMTTSRPHVVVEATADGETWHPYRYPFQADDPHEPPRWAAPHQPRVDWQLWFAALRGPRRARWVTDLLGRLAAGNDAVTGLLADDPLDGHRPAAVRAVLYDYRFTDLATRRATGRWWERERRGVFHPPVRR